MRILGYLFFHFRKLKVSIEQLVWLPIQGQVTKIRGLDFKKVYLIKKLN